MPDDRQPDIDPETGEVLENPSSPFNEFLLAQREGNLHGELSEQLAGLAEAVAEQGRQGSLTLKLTMAPDESGTRLLVRDETKYAPPEPPNRPSVFFRDHKGRITRRDPRQMDLEDVHRRITNANSEEE